MNFVYGGCMYPLNSQSSSASNTALPYYIAESSNDGYLNDNNLNDGYLPESNDQLADQITTLAGQINAANYRFLKLIAEFDRRKGWEGYGIRSCAHWLNWKCGIAMAAAREKVRTAKALEGLPSINEAFQKGALSFSKVRAMTRVATEENEDYLLNIAEYGTAQHMEVLVKAYRAVSRIADKPVDFYAADLGITEEEQEKRRQELQYENRMVSCYQDDGSWIIKAKLPQEEGGLIAKVLKELGDKIAESQSSDQLETDNQVPQDCKVLQVKKVPQKSAKSVSAETFSDESDSAKKFELDKKEEKLTFPQRRADALVAMAEHYLASSGKGSILSLKGAERCQLVMHVTTAMAGIKGTELGQNLDGRWLIPGAARKLACDASLVLVEEDTAGNVLNIGRRSRIIPPAMQRALAIRDGGCQFPGCCETRYVEGHHIKHWADGGETKLENLVTLCRYHHRELHKGSFYLSLKPEQTNQVPLKLNNNPQRFTERLCFSKVDKFWDAPFNKTKDFVIAANPAKFTCACCDSTELGKTIPPLIYNAIDEKTAVTKWTGERMDLEMAIEGILNADKNKEQ